MAFNAQAVADAIKTKLLALSGMGSVQIGVPESVGPRVSAYITMGSMPSVRKTTEVVRREARYFVNMAYRVDGAETTAETTLMGLADAFLSALYADLTLGGTCKSIEIDTGLADTPDYQLRAGKEYREYPFIITAAQDGNYTVSP